jgi:hypothetical protein
MAQVKNPPFVAELKEALGSELKQVGITAKVSFERVPATKLYRFGVLARKFKTMPHSERQNLVWRIADRTLPAEKQIRISMILTLTPEEAGYEKKESKIRRVRRAKSA